MNYLTVGIGIAAIAYGIYTAVARVRTPEKFHKLEPMKKFWGEKAGLAVHFMGYTLIPIIAGTVFVIIGSKGQSLFG